MTLLDVPAMTCRTKRWTKREFSDLSERGVFDKQPLMLLQGDVIEMSAIGYLHVVRTSNVLLYLVKVFDPD